MRVAAWQSQESTLLRIFLREILYGDIGGRKRREKAAYVPPFPPKGISSTSYKSHWPGPGHLATLLQRNLGDVVFSCAAYLAKYYGSVFKERGENSYPCLRDNWLSCGGDGTHWGDSLRHMTSKLGAGGTRSQVKWALFG